MDLIDFENEKSQLLLKSGECGEEEVKIELHANSTVRRIGKKLNLLECAGEFIGIGYFAEKDLVDFSRYLVEGVSDGQENNFFEHALNKLCQSREVLVLPTGEIKCLEIDFPEDLEAARKLFTE